MTARHACSRCDTPGEAGHHLCVAPSDRDIDDAIIRLLGWSRVCACSDGDDSCGGVVEHPSLGRIHLAGCYSWAYSWDAAHRDLTPLALARGYRWMLTQVGDGTEYRARFERHLGTPGPTAIDKTPARAWTRAFVMAMGEKEC